MAVFVTLVNRVCGYAACKRASNVVSFSAAYAGQVQRASASAPNQSVFIIVRPRSKESSLIEVRRARWAGCGTVDRRVDDHALRDDDIDPPPCIDFDHRKNRLCHLDVV